MSIHTIDCHYTGEPEVAAAYLLIEGDEAAFVETNTAHAIPHLLAALEANGLAPDAVRYIIITHIHLDHAGGAGALLAACPNATLLAHPRAAPHAIDPTKLIASAEKVYGVERFRALYGELLPIPADRVRTMDDGEELQWGSRTLTFLHTRGHANHHFCIHDSRENGVFTGDSFGIIYPAVQGGGRWAFPSTSPTDFDPAAAIASIHRILNTEAERAWPTHYGEVTDLADIAEALIAQLERYAALLDKADATGLEGEALDALCATSVDRWFAEGVRERGLPEGTELGDLIALDRTLNAQGVAFAVRKRRYKRKMA